MGRFLRRLRRSSCAHPAAPAGLVLAVATALAAALGAAACAPAAVATVEEGVVVRAVDGDTLVVRIEGREEKVRLLGVDTPESVHPRRPVERYGKEAAAFTRSLAEGRTVRLRDDPSNTNRDRYGRILRYVFLPDGTLLNAAIIAQGYGHAYTRFPFERMEEFRALERRAREEERGLWAPEPAAVAGVDSPPPDRSKTGPDGRTPGAGAAGAGETRARGEAETPSSPGVATTESVPDPRARTGRPEEIVYVTRTGTRYHAEGCRSLVRSAIPVKLKDLAARYQPCALCSPPVRAERRESSGTRSAGAGGKP